MRRVSKRTLLGRLSFFFLLLGTLGMLSLAACGGGDPGCKEDKDCGANKVCKSGKCEDKPTGCKDDTGCKSGEVCEQGTCKPKATGCKDDSECGTDKVCKNGKCEDKPTTGCKDDSECGTGKVCKNGKCEDKATGCKDDAECGTGKVCKNGTCEDKATGCKDDTECGTGKVCKNGTCEDKTTGCKDDAECGANKVCKNGKCEDKVVGPGCGGKAPCKADELCFNQDRCIAKRKTCKDDKDCGADSLCAEAGGKKFCVVKCDPTTNKSKEDLSNAKCYGGWGWCLSVSRTNPKAGACTPPQSKTRKKGESCSKFATPEKPEYHACEDKLECFQGKCQDGCDPSKGQSTNPVCKEGFFCNGQGTRGVCAALPTKKQGTKKIGEACSNVTKERFCDGDKGLFCNYPKCAKACDPRKGKDGNTACGANEECIEETSYSFLGGVCLAKASKKEGETCNSTDQRCLSGLNCHFGRCGKACDGKKPQPDVCGADSWCYTTGDICVKKCDPQDGVTANAKCAVGHFCRSSTTTYKPGYCRPLPGFKQGTKQLNEACSSLTANLLCDGAKKLYCYTSSKTCQKACDFRKGATSNPGCSAGEECTESITSPLGGVCLPQASQKLGEVCNSTDKRCTAQLKCDLGHCAKVCDSKKPQPDVCAATEFCNTTNTCRTKCDPKKGVVGNTACSAGQYCRGVTAGTAKPGYCSYLPKKTTGTKKAGETCSTSDPKEFCDGSAELTCFQTKCVKACDPSKGKTGNPNCSAQDECTETVTSSHLGGSCIPKPNQKENEECDGAIKRCQSGLTCITFGTKAFCQKDCDPKKTGECAAGYKCEALQGGGAVCIKTLQKIRKLYEECGGAPMTPEYDDCDAKYVCAGTRSTKNHCLEKCDTKNPTCPNGFVCLPLSSTSTNGVCAQTCTAVKDCANYGTQCSAIGSQKVCL